MWKWMSELEQEVGAEWEAVGKDLSAFPQLCQQRLAEIPFDMDCATFVEQLLQLDYPSRQGYPNKEFGNVAITVASNADFRIDVYVWNMGRDTSIHDHHFTGAYRPIYGISKQLSFSFEPEIECDAGLTKGILRHCETRTIANSDAAEIPLGEKLIHLVEHIGFPTVTVCIRTHDLASHHLNSFFFPGYRLVYDRQFPLATRKKLKLLIVMAMTRQQNWQAQFNTFLQSLPLCELFSLTVMTNRFISYVPTSVRTDFTDAIRACVEQQHPEWASVAEEHQKTIDLKTSKQGGGNVFDYILAQTQARSKQR